MAEYVTFQLIKNTGIDISDVEMVVAGVWMGGIALFYHSNGYYRRM